MEDKNKHLVYAEDILWEIMQHPSRNISKSLIKQLVEKVIKEKEITIGMCMPQG